MIQVFGEPVSGEASLLRVQSDTFSLCPHKLYASAERGRGTGGLQCLNFLCRHQLLNTKAPVFTVLFSLISDVTFRAVALTYKFVGPYNRVYDPDFHLVFFMTVPGKLMK